MNPHHSYRPGEGHGLRSDPFGAIVGPRPIGWISTIDEKGVVNLAPYSFFNAFNYSPPIIGFASVGAKDTLANARLTGEFVWNLATRPLAEAMNLSSAERPSDENEFEIAGLAPLASADIRPPRVALSPVAFECRVTQIVQLQAAEGALVETWLVLGEVVMVHIDQRLIVDGRYDTVAAAPILRGGGGGDYFEIGAAALFRMKRPS